MGPLIQSLFGAIFIAEFIAGILGNGFIAAVNIMDSVKKRKISSVDQILTALAISRFTAFWFMIIIVLVYIFCSNLLITKKVVKIITVSWAVSNHFNIWLATCLSTFYFLKIGNFSNSIFLHLKWRVNKVIPVTLLTSLVLLFVNIIVTNIQVDTWFDGFKSNLSYNSRLDKSLQFTKITLFNNYIFTFIPLTLSLMTLLLLVASLWRHLQTMQLNAGESRQNPSTTTHIRALQTLTAFLLLHVVVLLSFFVLISRFEILEQNRLLLYHHIIENVHPSVHSCVLILADNKLRQASIKVLWWLRGKPQDTQHLGS